MIAFVLAALWLPAVWHCGMELVAADVETERCCSHDTRETEAAPGVCVADHCGVFDEGHFRTGGDVSSLTPPTMVWFAVLPELWRSAGAVTELAVEHVGSRPPVEFAQRWNFELRTAPWANAPDLMAG